MADYTETERRILDMWPKFEDGSYVMLGDKAVANSGENAGKEFTARNVYFENAHGKLRSSALDGCYWNWKSVDPYVKRPAPKALDADGVPIKVGDTVWVDGVSESCEVVKVENSIVQVQYADGDIFECCSSDITHVQPDNWGRLKDDATMSPWSYCNQHEIPIDTVDVDFATTTEAFALDLIRRAKALAEKGAE